MKNLDNFFRTTAPAIKDVDEILTDECKIEAVVVLDAEEFEDFRRRLFVARDFIADNHDYMYLDRNGISHCLLVLGEGQPDGILVDSGLSQHAKFTSFLPNAADFMEKQIRMMADEILSSNENTIDFKTISDKFDVTVTADNGIGRMLLDELRGRNGLANVEVTHNSIELTRVKNALVEVDDKRLMTLFMLMGCNLENIHIVDADVEHDLATVVELNQDMLTEDGKREWSDVLGAKVTRIFDGIYGTQIEVTGCEPERLEAFSKMLAGECTLSESERWLNPVADDETFDLKFE